MNMDNMSESVSGAVTATDVSKAAVAKTGIAFLGCGYVADFYQQTYANHTDSLTLHGIWDQDTARVEKFADFYKLDRYASFEEMLADPQVEIIVNLTNPHAHYATNKRILEAGKHVYSEKPLAMEIDQARELVALAEEKGLQIVSAPSSVLGPAAQRLWQAVRERELGAPRLVYAEIDDGMIHKMGYAGWLSSSGTPWPAKDEFYTGCTLEHAGYMLTWLVAMFGPVTEVVSMASLCIPDKGGDTPENYTTADFSCALLRFESGMTARLTNSIIAPHDHRLRIFCDGGELCAHEVWNFHTNVDAYPLPQNKIQRGMEKYLHMRNKRKLAVAKNPETKFAEGGHPMDFVRGVADMAAAVREGRPARLGSDFSLHITEVTLAIQYPEIYGTPYVPQSRPAPIEPV
ncbi:Gfo/Idh/MocA family protein [Celeribacter sp. PS-C1]|uniref:Gfo/Idh/MocA family protein n=1 Tax=Celeribacter sp. PS-C1 TaxID=2820813 RepID=UPI001C66F6AF|nr:Gfo/Idh/MocA family oxidoreductase [Celeribacter sp. PS-C1]MBW6416924.1 Gfo/Idh/MocA family oxidoreductase [Celeribacter sp. PS-C1]